MKFNKNYRRLREWGVSQRIALVFFRHPQVNIILPDPDNNRPGYEKGIEFAKSLIKRGCRVLLEDESCRQARFNLWLWQEHSRFFNESVKKAVLRDKKQNLN